MNMTTHLEGEPDAPELTDAVIGARVHQLMWPDKSKTQTKLAELLHVDQAAISKRLHGKTQWRATEIALVADWLGVDVCDLLVPPAGFEPAAFCSEDPQDGARPDIPRPLADVLPFPQGKAQMPHEQVTFNPNKSESEGDILAPLLKLTR